MFTSPVLARVGALEQALIDAGTPYKKAFGDACAWQSAARVNAPVYAYKVLADAKGDRLLGAHVIGPGAEELINLFSLAMQHDLRVPALRQTTLLYPTAGSDFFYMLP